MTVWNGGAGRLPRLPPATRLHEDSHGEGGKPVAGDRQPWKAAVVGPALRHERHPVADVALDAEAVSLQLSLEHSRRVVAQMPRAFHAMVHPHGIASQEQA